MKAINCLFVSLVAGSCASAALAGGDDVTKFIQPKQVTKARMFGHIGGTSGFGTRAATVVDYYSNVDLGANGYLFYGTGVTTSGDPMTMEKGGTNGFGNPVGPVGSATKVGEVEFWVVASDGTTNSTVDCTVTLEMFDSCVDWLPLASTCMTLADGLSGDQVNRQSLGGFYVDLNGPYAPYNGYVNGYVLDIGTAGFPWNVPDGNGFLDERCWEYNGGSPPAVLAAGVFNAYDGSATVCGAAPGAYPALGVSFDNFYYDADLLGTYTRTERYFYGGFPAVANLMVRLAGNDGCSYDLNGDGFVTGDDTDYGTDLSDSGCPF